MCFLWGCVELDRGQTSHSTSSGIVLQTVPARLAKRQPEETFSTLLVFSVLSPHPALYLSQSFSLILSSFSFLTISVPTPSPHPACLRHLSVSLVFLSLSLLLEDTRCKQSSSQRHTLHTISLAFKGVEYSQLCWKLNSLKPPFPLQQLIVGEFSVFGEQLGLSRGWCQRAPIVPCSTAVSPPPRLPSTFPSSPDTHFVTEKRKSGMCISRIFFSFLFFSLFLDGLLSSAGGPDYSKCVCARALQNTSYVLRQGREHSSHRLHISVVVSTALNMISHATPGWQGELYGWEIKAFGIALSQNRSVIRCLLPSRRLTFYLWSKMWFYCQTQLVVPRRVLLRWEKWHLLEERMETVMKEWQLSVSAKASGFNL